MIMANEYFTFWLGKPDSPFFKMDISLHTILFILGAICLVNLLKKIFK
jgi:hypothetical protein